MSREPLVRKTNDPRDTQRGARKEQERAERFASHLQAVMRTIEGRSVMWELLARAGIFRSIWDPSSKIHYNAGRQDYGHELLAELVSADGDLYLEMEREQRAFARAEDRGNEAAHTPRADASEGAR